MTETRTGSELPDSITQRTLDGGTTTVGRERPTTLLFCHECDEFVLRSQRFEHDGIVDPSDPDSADPRTDDDEEDREDLPGDYEADDRVGGVYDITLSYSVDYRFRIAAYSEHEAEERAKDLKLDARPAASHHVHTRKREVKEVFAGDDRVPGDWDPYGSTPLDAVYWEDPDDDEEDEAEPEAADGDGEEGGDAE